MHNVTILKEAIEFYKSKYLGLGKDFLKEIKSSIEIIYRFSECRPLRKDETRRYLVNRFPFLIIYTFINKHIWIIAFAHCKRKPEYWNSRLNNY